MCDNYPDYRERYAMWDRQDAYEYHLRRLVEEEIQAFWSQVHQLALEENITHAEAFEQLVTPQE